MSDEIVVGQAVRFFTSWDMAERFGTVTRIAHNIIWVGAYCYHVDNIRRLRKWVR